MRLSEGDGVQGVVVVAKRAKVVGEDNVGLVAFAREEALHPFESKSGKPPGFKEEVVAKGEVNIVVLMS